MGTLTALQIISRFEPSKAQGFYTDTSVTGVIQLNFGYGLDFTANPITAVSVLKQALLASGVSQSNMDGIASIINSYLSNPGQVTGNTSPLVVQLNAILVSANVPVTAVAQEATNRFFYQVTIPALQSDLGVYGLTLLDLPPSVLAGLEDLRYNTGSRIYNPKTGTSGIPGLQAALENDDWGTAAYLVQLDPIAVSNFNSLPGLAYRRDTEAATMLGFDVEWNSNNTIQSLSPDSVNTDTLVSYAKAAAARGIITDDDPNDSLILTSVATYLVHQGLYVVQPGDTWASITNLINAENSSNNSLTSQAIIDAPTLQLINNAISRSSQTLTPGTLIYVPISFTPIGPIPSQLPPLTGNYSYVFDAGSSTGTPGIYTVVANPDPTAGDLIIDSTDLSIPAYLVSALSASGGNATIDFDDGNSVTFNQSGSVFTLAYSSVSDGDQNLTLDLQAGAILTDISLYVTYLKFELDFSQTLDGLPVVLTQYETLSYGFGYAIGVSISGTFTPAVIFATNGSNGDTVSVSGSIIDIIIGADAIADVQSDIGLPSITDLYTFTSNSGELEIGGAFSGTISGFQPGDEIAFGADITSAVIVQNTVLVIQETDGTTVSIPLVSADIPSGSALSVQDGVIRFAPEATATGSQTITFPAGTSTISYTVTPATIQVGPVRAGTDVLVPVPVGTDLGSTGYIEFNFGIDVGTEQTPLGPELGFQAVPDLQGDVYLYDPNLPGDNFFGNVSIDFQTTIYQGAVLEWTSPPAITYYQYNDIRPVDLGTVHIDQTETFQVIFTNAATATLSDSLIVDPGTSSDFKIENGLSLGPGQTGTVTVYFAPENAGGVQAGDVFDLISHDSVLPDEVEGGSPIVEAMVFGYAQPELSNGTPGTYDSNTRSYSLNAVTGPSAGTLTSTGNGSWELNFGTIDEYDTTKYDANIIIQNAAPDTGYSDELSGTFSFSGSGFIDSGVVQAGTASAGSFITLSAFVPDLSLIGANTETVVYTPSSIDSSGTSVLPNITLTVVDDVVVPSIPNLDIFVQGSLVTASVSLGEQASLDQLLVNAIIGSLVLQGPGVAEFDSVASVNNLQVASGASLLLEGGIIDTDPVTIEANGDVSGFGTITGDEAVNGFVTATGGTLELTGEISGTGTLIIAANSTLQLDGPVDAGVVVEFQSSGTGVLLLVDPAAMQGTIEGQGTGDQVVDVTCYVEGTRIATRRGELPVEMLETGEIVHTVFAGLVAVAWVGRRHVDCRRHPRPEKVWPVRIAAGAYGEGLPRRDLLLSPDHAVFADDVLIPVKHLINGISIVQVPMDAVTYYHVELPRHDLLLAEGMPVESYLDTGNRSTFANDCDGVALFPDLATHLPDAVALWEAYGCAPLVITGPELEAVRGRLGDRTVALSGAWNAVGEAQEPAEPISESARGRATR